MDEMTLIIAGAFGAAVMIIFVITRALMGGGKDTKLRDRLVANPQHDPARDGVTGQAKPSNKIGGGATPMMQRIGQAAAKPFMPNTREKQSGIKKKLGEAGIYSASAIRVMSGFKVIMLGAGLVGGYLYGA